MLKILLINIAVIILFLCVFLLTPALVNSGYESIGYAYRVLISGKTVDDRALLPNYKEEKWARKHFEEFNSLSTRYHDYIIWRRSAFKGETININEEGIRFSTVPVKIDNNKIYNFYGGSTLWGTGSRDHETISSVFAKRNNVKVVNYGETGYIDRQSFALLSNGYIQRKLIPGNNYVIFYGGVNDVIHRCRKEIEGLATSRQTIIQNYIDKKDNFSELSFAYLIQPWDKLIESVSEYFIYKTRDRLRDGYVCDLNSERATEIANTLVDIWYQAQKLTEANDDEFLAVLQPVAYIGEPQLNHLPEVENNTIYSNQFKSVYPLIINSLKRYPDLNFIDLTHIFDTDEYFYIDFCHVSPNANPLIVDKISNYIF